MNIFKNDFEQKWEELSQDVKRLNEYTALHSVELKGVEIKERNLDGAIFTGAKFSGVEWERSTNKKSIFTKVVFEKCKFMQSDFSYSTFTDVIFRDCEFVDAEIDRSKLFNVKFEDCKFTQMGLVENQGNTLVFVNCHMLDSGMGDCTIDFEITDCILDGVDVSTSKGGRTVLIEGGLLSEVDFGDSHFSTVTLRRVTQGEGPVRFNGATAETIKVEDVDMWRGLSLAEVKAESVSIEGGQIKPSFANSTIAKIYIRNSDVVFMSLRKAKLPYISITDCKIGDIQLWNGFVEEMLVQNCSIGESYGKNFKADTVVWDNITLDGKIDLTNAQIKDFRPSRITRGPDLNLITTGSNLKF